MPRTVGLHVKLPEEAVDDTHEKIATGEFACESDVLNEGLEFLRGHDEERRLFEQSVVIRGYESMMADPSKGISIEQLEANLAARRLARGAR